MRRSVLIILAVAVLGLNINRSASAAGQIAIEADSIEFSADGRVVQASGRVTLTYGDLQLKADTLSCRGSLVHASGGVILAARGGTLHADRLELDLETEGITAENIRGELSGYLVRARLVSPGTEGVQILVDAGLTRCGLSVPCYELLAGRISIDGRKVTIERGWLALKGRRFLPLPRMSLDLDRLEEWPSLSGGFDDRGLYVEASFAVPVGEAHSLILSGEFSSKAIASLQTAFAWRPNERLKLQPWLGHSRVDGWQGGLEVAAAFTSLTVELETSYGQLESCAESSLVVRGPSWPISEEGALNLAGFLTWEKSGLDPEQITAGVTLAWTVRRSPGNQSRYDLSLGRAWSAGTAEPLIVVGTEITRRLASRWGFDLGFSYDVLGGSWEAGQFGLVRHLHCYYIRLGYDWTEGVVDASVGIDF